MVTPPRALALLTTFLLALLPSAALAASPGRDSPDRAGIFTTINITEDHPAGDVACLFCTVNIDGDVHGDLAVVFGSVHTTSDRTIGGDVAIVFSTLHLGEDSHVKGDLASVFSHVDIDPSASVSGGHSVVGSGFTVTALLAPLLLLAGLIWLVVFFVRERRSRRYLAMPPAARRF